MAAFGLDQIASLYDPSVAVDQAALQRRMELAQALRKQAMTPVDTSGRQVGNMGYRVSPLEGVAKMVQALQANRADASNDTDRLALQQHMAAAMQQAMGPQGQPSAPTGPQMSTPDNPQLSVPPAQSVSPNSRGMTMADLLRGGVTEAVGGSAMAGAYADQFKTPEAVKVMRATGQDPQQVGSATLAKLLKEASAPTRLGNAAYAGPDGQIHGLPQGIPGAVQTPDPTAPGGWSAQKTPGAADAIQSAAAATAAGKASQTPFAGVDAKGNPLPVQSVAAALRGTQAPEAPIAAQVPPDVQAKRDATRQSMLADELRREPPGTPAAKAIQTELAATNPGSPGGIYAAPPLGAAAGAETGAKNRQNVMKEDYTALSNANSSAQTVISRLQTIKQLGPQAITGAESEKRDFLNGLLSLGGFKSAVDAKTAGDLIDKNAAQIALAIGAGSQGTDALRALALTANPGRHMNVESMQKAADSLIGPLQATQAKTQLLTPHFTSGDAETYLTKKQAFEKAADPRIWELHNLSPDAQKTYVQKLSPADAKSLLENRGALKQMGVFQ